MDAAANMLWRSAPFILVLLVQFCRAVDLNCTCTHSGDLVTYSIDDSQLPETKNSCHYSWDNSSTVLANHRNNLGEVTNNNLNTLQTSRCFVELNWKASCTSKTGHVVDFTASCTTSCGKDFLSFKGGHSTLWFLVVLILPVAALIFLLFKFRMQICSDSTRSCGQCGGLYTSVKMQNTDPKPEEVVVENK